MPKRREAWEQPLFTGGGPRNGQRLDAEIQLWPHSVQVPDAEHAPLMHYYEFDKLTETYVYRGLRDPKEAR